MIETIVSICLGIGLAASAGFRVFVPLLVVSIATHFGYIPVGESFSWIGSTAALIVLAIATVAEILGYYIPFFDNLLDTLAVPLAAVSGTVVMASTLVDLDPMITWALAIIAGGGTAAGLSTSMAATRAASSVKTAGIANPVVSTAETGGAVALSTASVFIPVIAGIIAISLVLVFFFIFKRIIKSSK
jgi:hypothetical protein